MFLSMMAKYIPEIRYGTPSAMKELMNDRLNVSNGASSVEIKSIVIHVYNPAIMIISTMSQRQYARKVISKKCFDLYISIRLITRVRIAIATNIRVNRKVTELPKPNQAVSENGI